MKYDYAIQALQDKLDDLVKESIFDADLAKQYQNKVDKAVSAIDLLKKSIDEMKKEALNA